MKKRIIHLVLAICVSFAGMVSMPLTAEARTKDENTGQTDSLNLHARSAVLMDADSGRVLYGKNAEEVMPMASTTKIMTCILALECGNLADEVTASAYAAGQPKVHLGVRAGDKFRLEDLLYSLMLESHNDAAVMIAGHIGGSVEGFAKLMNQKARDIGCQNTWYITPNGLDATQTMEVSSGKKTQKIHSTTARELALVMRYCITESPKKEEFLKITRAQNHTFTDLSGKRSFSCNNHNAFLTMMEGALSGKTGFTGNAGYCYVGALKRGDKTFIVALLACGWPNNRSYKWADTRKLMTYGLENYEYREIKVGNEPDIFIADRTLRPVKVENGIPESGNLTERSYINLRLEADGNETLRLLVRNSDKITALYAGKSVLVAPVRDGDTVGTVEYRLNGEPVATYPVVASGNVEKISFQWCFCKIWRQFSWSD